MSSFLKASAIPKRLDVSWFDSLSKVLGKRFQLDRSISVAFVSKVEIRRLNKTYRSQDKATDVLSFALDTIFMEQRKINGTFGREMDQLGEVILCLVIMQQQARAKKHSLLQEFKILVIHGSLHLLGYDHVKTGEAKQMEFLEADILRELNQKAAKLGTK